MEQHVEGPATKRLAALVGEWSMLAEFEGAPPAGGGARDFDSRGVARVYEMSLSDGVWRLWRDAPDFSPLNFSQRYTGSFGDDGMTITGSWEICHDGTTWEHDVELTYIQVR
jgi:hypothetical protein